jgi:hypothetical protein
MTGSLYRTSHHMINNMVLRVRNGKHGGHNPQRLRVHMPIEQLSMQKA